MKLNDETIAIIAKLLQLAILTGTDIIDHLRMVELQDSESGLIPTDAYREMSENQLEKLLEEVKSGSK